MTMSPYARQLRATRPKPKRDKGRLSAAANAVLWVQEHYRPGTILVRRDGSLTAMLGTETANHQFWLMLDGSKTTEDAQRIKDLWRRKD